MAVKPILFNTEMVKAILDGRKTQTRRIIKDPYFNPLISGDLKWHAPVNSGDILWVRETWAISRRILLNVDPDTGARHWSAWSEDNPRRYIYRAGYTYMDDPGPVRWHPSIHMPKEAARIFLRVTDIRCERLQDITEQDARAEGLVTDQPEDGKTNINFMCSVDCLQGSARGKFALLWNSTIKKSDLRTYGWDANSWVWVIEFERGIRFTYDREYHDIQMPAM